MRKGIYTVKDDVSGNFEYYSTFNSDALALRDFRFNLEKSYCPQDLSLYLSGYLDTDTGCLVFDDLDDTRLITPRFIYKGVKKDNEVQE